MERSKEWREKISKAIKKKWKDESWRTNQISSLKKSFTSERIESISKARKLLWEEENSVYRSEERNLNWNKSFKKTTLKKYKSKYPLFCKVEDIRQNLKSGNIEVRCKNHKCKNSKEKNGWFEPTGYQLQERIRQVEVCGDDNCYFYCSQLCKDTCDLFNLRSDPNKNISAPYTNGEYQTFRKFVLERDEYVCQFCGGEATDVHHERPVSIEPFYALDPDFAWSSCENCHYTKGHTGDCSSIRLSEERCK
jgi:hypothetical protein